MTDELGFGFPSGAGTRQAKAAWVLANRREEWTAWKCGKIVGMVRESAAAAKAVQPSLKISLHGVPCVEREYDGGLRVVVGQDLQKLAPYVDVFGPMCYFQMLHRSPEWVHDVGTGLSPPYGQTTTAVRAGEWTKARCRVCGSSAEAPGGRLRVAIRRRKCIPVERDSE
jgi:hypothetical protein